MNTTPGIPKEYQETSGLFYGIRVFIIMITVILILFNNMLILLGLRRGQNISPVSAIIMRCLALTDLTVGIILISALVSSFHGKWVFGMPACKILETVMLACLFMTLYTLSVASVDKYILLFFPLKYPSMITTTRTFVVLGVLWSTLMLLSGSHYSYIEYLLPVCILLLQ